MNPWSTRKVSEIVLCSKWLLVWAAFLTGCFAQQSPSWDSTFAPERQQLLTAQSTEIIFALTQAVACERCPGGRSLSFTVVNKRTAQQMSFKIENEMEQVDELHVVTPIRGVVIGRKNWRESVISLVDLRRGVLDSFVGLQPTVSPDKRYVAYQKYFTNRYIPGVVVSSQVLVYDLTAEPEANRLRGVVAPSDTVNVGIPIYPIGSQNTPGDNQGDLPWSSVHEMTSVQFFWLNNQHMLGFAERAQGTFYIIVADLRRGLRDSRIAPVHVDVKALFESRCQATLTPSQTNSIVVRNMRRSPREAYSLDVDLFLMNPVSGCAQSSTIDVPIAGIQ